MAEEVLDQMAPFVHFGIVGDAPGPVGLGWDDCCGAAFVQVGAQPVVVEGLAARRCGGVRLRKTGNENNARGNAIVRRSGPVSLLFRL